MKHITSFLACAALLLAGCDSNPTMRETLPPDAAAELNELIEEVMPSLGGRSNHIADALFGKDAMNDALSELSELYGELLEDYDETGNVHLKTEPDAITPLHVAVMYRREALVRELLLQGADPNALQRTRKELLKSNPRLPAEMDAPLVWTVSPQWGVDREMTAESTIRLIDMLVAAGAEVKGDAGGHALAMCASLSEELESVYLHLLDLGADPMRGYQPSFRGQKGMSFVLRNGWCRAAERLHAAGLLQVDARDETGFSASIDKDGNAGNEWTQEETPLFGYVKNYIIHEAYANDEAEQAKTREFAARMGMGALLEAAEDGQKDEKEPYADPRLQASITLALDLGADVNAPHQRYRDAPVITPLLAALEKLPPADAPQERIAARGWLLQQLLTHGGRADTTYPEGGYGEEKAYAGKTVADIICSACPRLADWLAEHGNPLQNHTSQETP